VSSIGYATNAGDEFIRAVSLRLVAGIRRYIKYSVQLRLTLVPRPSVFAQAKNLVYTLFPNRWIL
jgi:hypothetical protein